MIFVRIDCFFLKGQQLEPSSPAIRQTDLPNREQVEMLWKPQPSHFGQFLSHSMDKFVPKASRGVHSQANRGMDFPEFGLSKPLICKILEAFCGKWKSLVWMDSAVQT
jgi:hypothetical protein